MKKLHQNTIYSDNQKGFTLMELVMAMAILTFLLAIITVIFLDVTRTFQSAISARGTQQEARYSLDELTRRVRYAHQIEVVADYVCFTDQAGPDMFRASVDGDRLLLEQVLNDCETGSVTNDQYLTSDAVVVQDFQVDIMNGSSSYGMPSAVITIEIATDTEDLIDGGQCEPGRAGSQYCSTTRFVQNVALRGDRE